MRTTREFGFKPTRGGSKYPSSHGPAKFGIARTLLGHIPNSPADDDDFFDDDLYEVLGRD